MVQKKPVSITALASLVWIIVGVACAPAATPLSTSTASLTPTETNILPLRPTVTPSETSPSPTPCPWIPYFYDGGNETPTPSAENANCPHGLHGVDASTSTKVSFFIHLSRSLGTYGVCRDISGENDLRFQVTVKDSIASARLLIMIAPAPDPTKQSSLGLRIQPGDQESVWVKFIEYTSDGYESDRGRMQAPPYLRFVHDWNFPLAFKFRGAEVETFVNKPMLSRQWPVGFSTRYLCLAYQPMPTHDQAANLEVQVEFP